MSSEWRRGVESRRAGDCKQIESQGETDSPGTAREIGTAILRHSVELHRCMFAEDTWGSFFLPQEPRNEWSHFLRFVRIFGRLEACPTGKTESNSCTMNWRRRPISACRWTVFSGRVMILRKLVFWQRFVFRKSLVRDCSLRFMRA